MMSFNDTQRTHIDALCSDLTQRVANPVYVEYGETDEGQHWAALCIETLPTANLRHPHVLASLVTGTYVDGPAAVLSADGHPVGNPSEFMDAVNTARFTAMQHHRALSESAQYA